MKFRLLRADEIDVRVAMVKENGVSLLLYKDARCDMNILDETVGSMNWQRSHSRDNANCSVSIWDAEKGQWISKEDTGTESNTEKEKGLASDSFKRACFNWGIGRELYTAPFIWVPEDLCNISQYKGKFTCRDRFKVSEIEYRDSRISRLVITSGRKRVFNYQEGTVKEQKTERPKQVRPSIANGRTVQELRDLVKQAGQQEEAVCSKYGVMSIEDLSQDNASLIINKLKKYLEGRK